MDIYEFISKSRLYFEICLLRWQAQHELLIARLPGEIFVDCADHSADIAAKVKDIQEHIDAVIGSVQQFLEGHKELMDASSEHQRRDLLDAPPAWGWNLDREATQSRNDSGGRTVGPARSRSPAVRRRKQVPHTDKRGPELFHCILCQKRVSTKRDLFWCGACEYQICRGCQASLSHEYKVVCANGRWRCREHR